MTSIGRIAIGAGLVIVPVISSVVGKTMRVVTLSDTHTYGKKINVPDGDLLLHAGDHTFRGTDSETKAALAWLESLPHKHKVIIAGNHDFFFDRGAPNSYRNWKLRRYHTIADMLAKFPSLTYLEDSGIVVEGWRIWGSPWTPWYDDWAFNFPRRDGQDAAAAKWAKIPEDTQILLTHTPPRGILDTTYPDDPRDGCSQLFLRLHNLPELRLHVFGHLHESFGRLDYQSEDGHTLTFVNAAINTREYQPTNTPIVVDL